MSFDPLALSWLPPPPADLRQTLRALDQTDDGLGTRLQFLAAHRLDAGATTALARRIATFQAAGRPLAPLKPFCLTILSNATVELAVEPLVVAGARRGLSLDVVLAPYDQVLQQALDPASVTNCAGSDATLLAIDHRWFGLDRADLGGRRALDAGLSDLERTCAAIAERTGTPPILQTLAPPPRPLFGSFDRCVDGSVVSMVDAANRAIVDLAKRAGGLLLDVAAVADQVGTARWHDPVLWNLYKLPMARSCLPLYADWVARLLAAAKGLSRKCLVLDLDNTLWGGVVGDDGTENLRLGQGDAEGEAFLSVQRYALELKSRGVILAVSSKNTDEVARAAFRSHPEMLLKLADVAVFQANWLDKASNLEAIASTLNIGTDALVLLDDNGAERALVRASLPAVAVPELPEDPADYATALAAAGYFEAVSFTAEDRLRADSYAANAARAEVQAQAFEVGDYLRSLEMRLEAAPFDAGSRPRIAQLINKSNQFNLTTRRYTEAQVARMETDPALCTLTARLRDRLGDLGLISVVICRSAGEEGPGIWEIDTWLMSCRVLGRKVEEAMLEALVHQAASRGATALVGWYLPTGRNAMVAEHYDRLGFNRVSEDERGARRYELTIEDYRPPDLPFLTD